MFYVKLIIFTKSPAMAFEKTIYTFGGRGIIPVCIYNNNGCVHLHATETNLKHLKLFCIRLSFMQKIKQSSQCLGQ